MEGGRLKGGRLIEVLLYMKFPHKKAKNALRQFYSGSAWEQATVFVPAGSFKNLVV